MCLTMEQPTVLVVEDNPITRKMLRVALQSEGYHLLEAEDGAAALRLMESGRPDLVVQDLKLPDIDGVELARRLRTLDNGRQTPILALSGFLAGLDAARRDDAGFTDYVYKPVEPRRLADLIRLHLSAAPEAALSGKRVLVVDDDPIQLGLAAAVLRQSGYEVDTASSGQDALQRARETPPDAILSDVLMPGMDGFRLCEAATRDSQLDGVRVVLHSSAYTEPEDRALARKLGACALVTREPGMKEALDALRTALDAPDRRVGPPAVCSDRDHADRLLRQLDRLLESRADLSRTLSVRELQISLLGALPEMSGHEMDAESVLAELGRQFADSMGLPRAAVFLQDENGLSVRWACGFSPDDLDRLPRDLERAGGPESCLYNSQAFVLPVAEVLADGPCTPADRLLLVPLRSGSRGLGLLVFDCLLPSPDRRRGETCLAFASALGAQLGQVLDVTEAFRRHREEEERLGHLLALSPAVTYRLDGDYRPTWISDNVTGLLGYDASELSGTWWEQRVHPEDLPRIREIMASPPAGERRQVEYRFRHADGGYRWMADLQSLVLDESGGLEEIVGAWLDITERRLAEERQREGEARERLLEEQLRQAQKMEAVGRLAGGVAHDFNNMLAVINGYSELLMMKHAADPRLSDQLQLILEAGNRAAGLTQQLLAFSRQQIVEPRVLDLNEIVSGVGTMLRRLIGEDILLAASLDSSLGKVNTDPGLIHQVLMNLAVNARDAMPTGGRLTIETRNVELDSSYTRRHHGLEPGPYVLLAISDTGCGMDSATQARIFEPFFTTKEKGRGTGLGLATVHGIVHQCGGHIAVYSEPGRGTSFKIYLPRLEDAGLGSGPEARALPLPGTETVLLVEDEALVRTLAAEVLRVSGYSVLEARSGAEALDLCDERVPDLLLTDVVMPGMSGRELKERLGARFAELPVVFMSGYTDDAVVRHGILEQEVVFLRKPFTPAEITRKVRLALDSRGRAPKDRK